MVNRSRSALQACIMAEAYRLVERASDAGDVVLPVLSSGFGVRVESGFADLRVLWPGCEAPQNMFFHGDNSATFLCTLHVADASDRFCTYSSPALFS